MVMTQVVPVQELFVHLVALFLSPNNDYHVINNL